MGGFVSICFSGGSNWNRSPNLQDYCWKRRKDLSGKGALLRTIRGGHPHVSACWKEIAWGMLNRMNKNTTIQNLRFVFRGETRIVAVADFRFVRAAPKRVGGERP
jgi:hypothetical protein